MVTKAVVALSCTCRLCHYTWTSAGAKPPARCAGCYSRAWNRKKLKPGAKPKVKS